MVQITRDGCIVDKLTDAHREELTIVKEANPYYNELKVIFEVFKLRNDGSFIVPRYWAQDHFEITARTFGYVSSARRLVFQGNLRSGVQQDAATQCIEQLQTFGGGVLSLATGMGKTVIALYVTCKLKLKTLIIVHKQFLMDQWVDKIRQFIPTARIGRLQQSTVQVARCDIVVGMLQSMSMHDYERQVFDDFGLIIFDEVHVVPTPVFSRALTKVSVPYMLGLSATPERRDGQSRIIHWFIGPTFFEHRLEGRREVTVRVVMNNARALHKLPIKQGVINMIAVTTILSKMHFRNALLVRTMHQLVTDGYKVIALSDRRAHCHTLMEMLYSEYGIYGSLYIGGMTHWELEESKESDVLLATYAMAKEGLDIPSLDALVLVSPRSDVVQACGRILHSNTNKHPVIVDIVDQWFMGRSQFNKRNVYYTQAGFHVRFEN